MINSTNQLQSEDTFSKQSKENIRYMDTYSQRYQYKSKNKAHNKENDIRNNHKQTVTKPLKSSISKANLVNQNRSNNYRLLTNKTEFSFIQHKEQANQANNIINKSDYSVKNELNKAFVILKEKSMQKSKSKTTLSSNTSIKEYLNKRHEEAKEKLRIIDKITKNQIEKECTFRPNISSKLKNNAIDKSNNNSNVFEKLARNKQHINTNYNIDKEVAHRPVINQQSKELSRSINDLYSWKNKKDNKISEVQRKKDEDYSNLTNCSFINKKSQELIKNKSKQALSIPDSQQDEISKSIEIEKKQEEPRQIVKHKKKQIENRDNPEYLMSIRSNLNDYYLHKKIDKQREEYKIYMTSTLNNEQKANTLRDKIEKNIQEKIKSIDYSNKMFQNLTEPYNDTLTFPNNSYKMLIKEHERLSDDNDEPDYQPLNYVYTNNLLDKTTSLMQEYTKENKPNDQTDNNFYYSYNNMAYLNKDSDAFQTEEYLINKRKKYESEFELIEQKNNKLNSMLKSNEISERGLISRF